MMKNATLGTFIACACLAGLSSCVNLDAIRIGSPDLSRVPDGSYVGQSEVFVVKVKAQVDVAAGRITAFKLLEHTGSPIGKPAEALADAVVEKQSFQLDAVSGASYSSKAILKAGENALSFAE
jgi:uncharacterized protein with FMN-binding domain